MRRRHWTVVIVLVLVFLGVGLVLPAISKVRAAAARSVCHSNFKGLVTSLHNYASADGNGSFPPGTLPNANLPPERRLSWVVPVVPYLDSNDLYRQFDLKAPADDGRNRTATSFRWKYFVCPASGDYEYDGRDGSWKSPTPLTHYVGVAGVSADAATLPLRHPKAGPFGYDRRTKLNEEGFPDGTSNTLLVIETAQHPGHWAFGGSATVRGIEPGAAPYIGTGRPFGGFHDCGWDWFRPRTHLCVAAMADGSVRSFTHATAPEVLEALATVGGKETLPADW